MRLTTILTASLAGTLSTASWATDPQSIDLAGFEFTPTLDLTESYDDNYRGLREGAKSSWITSINPSFLLSAEDRNSGYQLKYEFDNQTFHSDNDASHTNQHLTFKSAMAFTSRHRLDWNLGYHRIEETTDLADPDNEENDKYRRAVAGAVYSYGVQSGLNQLDFGANLESIRYHNSGNLNADEDRDSTTLNSVWYHRLGGSTRSLVELRHTDHDYRLSTSNRDSTNTAMLFGATWDATAKTSGTLRLGAERKNFDSSTREDYTSPMWEVGVAWEPRTYSVVKLNTRRAFDEGDDGASTVQDTTTRLSWEHEWTARISSDIYYRYSDRDYKAIEREDKRTGYGVGLTYSPDRWVDVSLGYRHTENDSSLREKTYDRNIYQLSLSLSL
ncbi:outer membrane beta-barrel protein [Phytopseudomonas dryadis]|uniref:Outer membrane beta-barrel protein n=1 Tax=Phytopseudomonas dryadis TaxID=2487520 RepID=A0A4Q9QUC1_9GAMM|nr:MULTISPECIES: outer membrane beta-barrel protein [Pseudomonas]TBU86714.1 hypothetical protein DNK44_22370 [Pseudomonas dryadis]TBV05425.1 hypothetical protein DNK34_12860 [Pseudomonas dryadis]TBV18434.1 hypothetical protein DNK41_08650 [Pseudomonas sp. FRB 230]